MNNELTAAQATIEKCREITGCPDGVDLQDWVKQLAAENVGLKDCIVKHYPAVEHWNSWADAEDKIQSALDTPATDRIVAGIKADGVEEFAAYCGEENSVFVEAKAYYRSLPDAAYEFAKQLREGADK